MELSKHSNNDLMKAFSAMKRRQISLLWVGFPFIIVLCWFKSFPEQLNNLVTGVMAIFAITYLTVATIFSLRNWRCPRCNKWLGRDLSPPSCKGCGLQFGTGTVDENISDHGN